MLLKFLILFCSDNSFELQMSFNNGKVALAHRSSIDSSASVPPHLSLITQIGHSNSLSFCNFATAGIFKLPQNDFLLWRYFVAKWLQKYFYVAFYERTMVAQNNSTRLFPLPSFKLKMNCCTVRNKVVNFRGADLAGRLTDERSEVYFF